MCVLAFAWQTHPLWRLIVLGNRDELHARSAAPLARWDEQNHLLAGRDLQSGGGWLGVSEEGRFAVVTNLRGYGDARPHRVSRGALVTDILVGSGRYADPDDPALADFNPFNLVTANRGKMHFLSNRPEAIRSVLAPGIYGLSNGALDEPWPKTVRLKAILRDWLINDATTPETLLAGLREDVLPDIGIGTAPALDVRQEPPSPIFIRDPVYGTVVAIDDQGRGSITERRYTPAGEAAGETSLSFAWPSKL